MPLFTGDLIPGYSSGTLCPPSLEPLIQTSGPKSAPARVFALEVADFVNPASGRVTSLDALVIENWYSTQMSPDIAALFGINDPPGSVVRTVLQIFDRYDRVVHPVPVNVRIVTVHGPQLFLLSWKSLNREFDIKIRRKYPLTFLDLTARKKNRCIHLPNLGFATSSRP